MWSSGDRNLQASLVHVIRDRDGQDPHATISIGIPTSSGLRFRILRPHAKGGAGQLSSAGKPADAVERKRPATI